MRLIRALSFVVLAAALLVPALLAPGCGGVADSIAAEDEGKIVIRRREAEDPRSMDPHISGDVVSSRHCGMAYDCLFQYDYLKRPAELVPCLAAEMPSYDAATHTYTFKLRDDVYFFDDRCFHPDAAGKKFRDPGEGEAMQDVRGKGRKLNAHDIVYSFKRLAALPDSGGFWVIEGQVKGLDEFRNEALRLAKEGPPEDPDKPWREYLNSAQVEGLKAIDDLTVQISLKQAYPQFLYAITLSYGAAVPHEAADYYNRDFFRKPVGTGAFILKRWRQNWEIVWERNPNYREEYFPKSTAPEDERFKHLMGKRLPIADEVHFRIIKESQANFLSFKSGSLDQSELDRDQFDSAIQEGEVAAELQARGVKALRYEEATIGYISFNMNDTTVGTPAGEKGLALRRALALSIDREDFIRRYLNGRGSPATQLIPPGMKGHQPENNMQSQRYDPARGREILSAAGFEVRPKGTAYETIDPETGKPVTIVVSFRSLAETMKQEASYIASSALQVGVTIQPELMTFAEFLKRQDEGVGQAYDAGWVMDYPDAQNMLQLLYGPNKPPGINSASYSSPRYDALYKDMSVLDDNVGPQFDEKLELIGQMHEELDKDVPWILFEFRVTYVLYHQWYTPPKPNEFAYTYIKFAHADSEARGEKARGWTEAPFWPGFIIVMLALVPVGLVGWKIARQM